MHGRTGSDRPTTSRHLHPLGGPPHLWPDTRDEHGPAVAPQRVLQVVGEAGLAERHVVALPVPQRQHRLHTEGRSTVSRGHGYCEGWVLRARAQGSHLLQEGQRLVDVPGLAGHGPRGPRLAQALAASQIGQVQLGADHALPGTAGRRRAARAGAVIVRVPILRLLVLRVRGEEAAPCREASLWAATGENRVAAERHRRSMCRVKMQWERVEAAFSWCSATARFTSPSKRSFSASCSVRATGQARPRT